MDAIIKRFEILEKKMEQKIDIKIYRKTDEQLTIFHKKWTGFTQTFSKNMLERKREDHCE